MKELKLTFIEEGLTEKELADIVGGVMESCNSLENCWTYSGDCQSLLACSNYKEKTNVGGSGSTTTNRPIRTGIIT